MAYFQALVPDMVLEDARFQAEKIGIPLERLVTYFLLQLSSRKIRREDYARELTTLRSLQEGRMSETEAMDWLGLMEPFELQLLKDCLGDFSGDFSHPGNPSSSDASTANSASESQSAAFGQWLASPRG
jgi:hypothetical protein